jgi:hypothetical protein
VSAALLAIAPGAGTTRADLRVATAFVLARPEWGAVERPGAAGRPRIAVRTPASGWAWSVVRAGERRYALVREEDGGVRAASADLRELLVSLWEQDGQMPHRGRRPRRSTRT